MRHIRDSCSIRKSVTFSYLTYLLVFDNLKQGIPSRPGEEIVGGILLFKED